MIYENWGSIKDFVSSLWNDILSICSDVGGAIGAAFKSVFDGVEAIWSGNFSALQKDVDSFVSYCTTAFKKIGEAASFAKNIFQSKESFVKGSQEANAKFIAEKEARRGERAMPTAGVIRDNRGPLQTLPPMAGATVKKDTKVTQTFNVTVQSQPGAEAGTAADTVSRLQSQQPAIAGGYNHD